MTEVALGTWAFGPLATGPQMVLPEVFERTALLGFDGVELGAFGSHGTPETWSTAGARDQLRAAIARRELGLAGVITFARSSIVRDPVPNEYLAYFDTSLRFCVDLGATTLVVHTVDPPEIVEEIGHRTALDRLVHTWAECAQRAHAVGVTLAWEFEAGSAFNTAEDVVEIANALSMPGFGVLYDTVHAHMACGGEREPTDDAQIEFLGQLRGNIAHVHVADTDGTLTEVDAAQIDYGSDGGRYTTTHVPLGSGVINFERVLPAVMEAAGPQRWVSVDLCLVPDAWKAAETSLEFLRQLGDRNLLPLEA